MVSCRAPYPLLRVLDWEKVLYKVVEQIIKGFRAAIPKKTHFLAKKRPFFGLKQCFCGLSGHR